MTEYDNYDAGSTGTNNTAKITSSNRRTTTSTSLDPNTLEPVYNNPQDNNILPSTGNKMDTKDPYNPFLSLDYQDALDRYYDKVKTEHKRESDRQINQTMQNTAAVAGARGIQDSGISQAMNRRATSEAYGQLGAQLAGVDKSRTAGIEGRVNELFKNQAAIDLEKAKADLADNNAYYKIMGYTDSLSEDELGKLRTDNPSAYNTYMAGRANKTADDNKFKQDLGLEALHALVANAGDLEGEQFRYALQDIYNQFGVSANTDVVTGEDLPVEVDTTEKPDAAGKVSGVDYEGLPVEAGAGTRKLPYRLDDAAINGFQEYTYRPNDGARRTNLDVSIPNFLTKYVEVTNNANHENVEWVANQDYQDYWGKLSGQWITVDGDSYQVSEDPLVQKQIFTKKATGDKGKTWKFSMPVVKLTKNGEVFYLVPPIHYDAWDQNWDQNDNQKDINTWTVLDQGQSLNDK